MQTSMRIAQENRNALAALAAELGGVSLDEALRVLLFQHQARAGLDRLRADPAAWADYLAEARSLAESDAAVQG
jgi:hypothetical protein